jgi:DNA-binding transcriptional regulator YbjK
LPAGRDLSRRGANRRDALLRAAAAVVAEQGLGALTHRAVAARAGLPLAATTYYFRSKEELAESAVELVAAEQVDAAWSLALAVPERASEPGTLARDLLALAGLRTEADRESVQRLYERYAEAGRHPWLRPIVARWTRDLAGAVAEVARRRGFVVEERLARDLVAVTDGILLAYLAASEEVLRPARAALTRVLERML